MTMVRASIFYIHLLSSSTIGQLVRPGVVPPPTAKPGIVSPPTAKPAVQPPTPLRMPCSCPQVWDPVCAKPAPAVPGQFPPGQGPPPEYYQQPTTIPSACEADCYKMITVSKGACSGTPAGQLCTLKNRCQLVGPAPICTYGVTFPNQCIAKCFYEFEMGDKPVEFPARDVISGQCADPCQGKTCPAGRKCASKPGKCFQEPCSAYKCIDSDCKCDDTWDPVCFAGVTYTSKCWATCDGVTSSVSGECKVTDPYFPTAVPLPKPRQLGQSTLLVADHTEECYMPEGPMQCMLVKSNPNDPDWTYFFSTIQGFQYEEGFTYKLEVMEEELKGDTASPFKVAVRLIKVTQKTQTGAIKSCNFDECDSCTHNRCKWQPGAPKGQKCSDQCPILDSDCYGTFVGTPKPVVCPIDAPPITMYVADRQVDCVAVGSWKCLLVRENVDSPWTFFYDTIEGFEYEAGFHYELMVAQTLVRDDSAAGHSVKYRLVDLNNKVPSVKGCTSQNQCGKCTNKPGCIWSPNTAVTSNQCDTICKVPPCFVSNCPAEAPSAPLNLVVPAKQITSSSALIRWKCPTGVNCENGKYQVSWSWEGVKGVETKTQVFSKQGVDVEFTLASLKASKQYTVEVRGMNGDQLGEPAMVSFSTSSVVAPVKKNSKSKKSKTKKTGR